MNDRIIYKFKKFRRVKITYEYALLFNNSNDLIDCVCHINKQGIISSKLYTNCGTYQLIITADQKFNYTLHTLKNQYVIFKDKPHIYDIKFKNQLICKADALQKLQKAFKGS